MNEEQPPDSVEEVPPYSVEDIPHMQGDSFEVPEGRPPIPNVRPLANPDHLDPELRRSYFQDHWYPYCERMPIKEYYQHKVPLQIELVKMQNWVVSSGERIIIVFEGRDAAGKGGTIRRFMEHLNPRVARVVALVKPSERERGQWYYQRYIEHFPTSGEIVLLDRSWYNRAGVERVMGFCTDDEYERFMQQTPILEKMLVGEGIRLIKLWFSVCQDEQVRRFHQRESDPLKQWKLSPIDKASLDKFDAYTTAKEEMFRRTHTDAAPWTLIKSDCKMRARINAMRHVLHVLPYEGKDPKVAHRPDPWILASADEVWDIQVSANHDSAQL